MFANFIYFIVVLLIYATYQPTAEPYFTPFDALLMFVGLTGLFAYVNWLQFRMLRMRIAKESFSRLDNRFHGLLTRMSIVAVVLFAVDVYGLDLPSYLTGIALFQKVPTLLALLFLAVFVGYLALVWWFAFRVYEALYPADLSRGEYVWSQVTFSVPILLPWLVLSGVSDLILALPFSAPKEFLSTTQGEAAYFMVFLLLVAMTGPAIIQKFWRCKPLEEGPARERIAAVCRRAGVEYANILYWPIFGGRMITAGVMGLVKRFRYILVTNALLQALDPAEVEAVIAHEIGHVKRKHLLFYLVFFAGYVLITYSVLNLLFYALVYAEPLFRIFIDLGIGRITINSIALSLAMILLFLVYFRFIFGYFMRNFERQADGYVYNLFDSSLPLITTLKKIAVTSGQPPDRPNWHHFSITERIHYLVRCEEDRSTIKTHDRKVRRSIGLYVAAMVVVAFFGYHLNYGEAGQRISGHFIEKILLKEIEKHPEDPGLYRMLGDLYYETENWQGVREAYETSLAIKSDNPEVLNNLAWFYATVDVPEMRNPQRALALARRAAELQQAPHIFDTLAESYYANDMLPEAIEAGQRALALDPDNRSYYQEQLEKFRRAQAEENSEQHF